MRLEIVGTNRLGDRAAEIVAAALRAAADERGRASLALSGGGTPEPMFAALAARDDVPWDVLHVWQVDERIAPPGHPDRNLVPLERHLGPVLPAGHLHAMPVDRLADGAHDVDAAAAAYAADLSAVSGDPPTLDVVQLGIGADGHTASLLPGDPVAETLGHAVAVSQEYQGRRRMTLTMEVLDRARLLLWLVAGADKAPATIRLRRGDPTIPAGRVRQDDALLLADPAAAAPEGG